MLINDWLSSFSDSLLRKRFVLTAFAKLSTRSAQPRRQSLSFPRQCTVSKQPEILEDRVLLSAANPFRLEDLLPSNGGTGANGFIIDGETTLGQAGQSVHSAGDVNGDGLEDLLVSAPFSASATYLVFGAIEGTHTSLNVGSLDGTNGYFFGGGNGGDRVGSSVSHAGDVNGDGFDDLIIGAIAADPDNLSNAGQSYLVFGGQSNLTALDAVTTNGGKADDGRINLDDLDGTTGFILAGVAADDFSGGAVSGAGDVNGDGFDDILIGAYGADHNGPATNTGASYVVFGGVSNLSLVDDVTSSGGVQNDGRINLADLDGTTGFALLGVGTNDRSGRAVSIASDVNGDGFDDILIGTFSASPNGLSNSGASYLVYGGAQSLSRLDDVTSSGGVQTDGRINLVDLDSASGLVINGKSSDDASGVAVSGAGDVNGDGFGDILIGAFRAFSSSGAAYLLFGGTPNLSVLDEVTDSGGIKGDGQINLADLDGTTGFEFVGRRNRDNTGGSLSNVGDVNGDGFDDILIGASSESSFDEQLSVGFVVFGGMSNLSALDATTRTGGVTGDGLINLADLNGRTGFVIAGNEMANVSSTAVNRAGDVNGDGFDDLLIGTPLYNPGRTGRVGTSFVVFGGNFTGSDETQIESQFKTTLGATQGATAVDILVGGRSDNLLTSDGGPDVLRGGSGDDILSFPDADFSTTRRAVGGTGNDTLRLDGASTTLDLTTIPDNRIVDIEVIDLRSSNGIGDSTLTLSFQEVVNLSSSSNTLEVRRDLGDTINIGDGWVQTARRTVASVTYDVFTQEMAELLIEDVVSIIPQHLSLPEGGGEYEVAVNESGLSLEVQQIQPSASTILTVPIANAGSLTITGSSKDDKITLGDLGGYGRTINFSGNGGDDAFDASTTALMTRFLGGVGDDTFTGGSGNDWFDGGIGADSVGGGLGNDSLFGGSGDDTISGDAGNDFINGDAGRDLLLGSNGDDTVIGGSGSDRVSGGHGNDSLNGNSGDDTLNGSSGDDFINGNSGRDLLTGDAGDDTILGGGGTDTLDGGAGNDFVHGQGGQADIVAGGGGDDTLRGGASDVIVSGSAGTVPAAPTAPDAGSTLTVTLPETGGPFSVVKFGSRIIVTLNGGSVVDVPFSGISDVLIIGTSGDDSVILHRTLGTVIGSVTFDGGAGDDSFNTSQTSILTSFVGGSGNDTLTGGRGRDIFNGGDGDDSASGGSGNDILNGGSGDDLLIGEAGNDLLNGGSGMDSLFGGDGDDTLLGGRDTDLLDGGLGSDTVNGQGGTGDIVAGGGGGTDNLQGDSSDSLIDGPSGSAPGNTQSVGTTLVDGVLTVALPAAGGSYTISPLPSPDPPSDDELSVPLVIQFPDNNAPFEGDLNLPFVIQSTGDNAPVDDQSSAPLVIQISDDVASIVINGGAGDDVVVLSALLSVSLESVTFNGGGGNDSLDSSLITADVVFNGGEGDDTLIGGSGNDLVNGGAGNDSIFTGAGADLIHAGIGNDFVDAGSDADTVFGDDGDDVLIGGAGNDILNGNGGRDTITGGDGDDKLLGGADADSLDGGLGDDTVRGQGGDLDVAIGGGGLDVVVP